MPRVGIRELKAHLSEIMRAVREDKARYIVTHQGKPVGILLPIEEKQLDTLLIQAVEGQADAELAAELEELSQEIARSWKERKSAVELLSEMRR